MHRESFSDLRAFIDPGRTSYRNRAMGAYLSALVVLAVVVATTGARFYEAGPIVLVGILGLIGVGFHVWYWRLGWSRHPVLIALISDPSKVVAAEVLGAHGRAALLEDRQVEIRTRDATIMLTLHRDTLAGLGATLTSHCPLILLIGF